MSSGRPLRFLGLCVIGWTTTRVMVLWPVIGSPEVLRQASAPITATTAAVSPLAPVSTRPALSRQEIFRSRHLFSSSEVAADADRGVSREVTLPPIRHTHPRLVAFASVEPPMRNEAAPIDMRSLATTPPLPGARPASDRWSGSAWLLLRPGKGFGSGLGSGQLGGAQAGVRLAYTIDEGRRLAIIGRVSTPLKGIGREASIGIEWQPTRLPLRLVAEQRFALDHGHGGPAIGLIGGTGPAPLALGFDLATYGQAGVVRRQQLEPFAEGAAKISRVVAAIGALPIDIGTGIWGGAQREATRLDIGPSLGTAVSIGKGSVRISLDWRERIAGHARPGSGAALTLGTDF